MTEFEYVLACLMIPVAYVLIYIAGKHDFLNLVCRMLEEKAKELKQEDE